MTATKGGGEVRMFLAISVIPSFSADCTSLWTTKCDKLLDWVLLLFAVVVGLGVVECCLLFIVGSDVVECCLLFVIG